MAAGSQIAPDGEGTRWVVAMVQQTPRYVRGTAVDDIGKLQGRGVIRVEGFFRVKLASVGRVECWDREEAVLSGDIAVDEVPVRTWARQ